MTLQFESHTITWIRPTPDPTISGVGAYVAAPGFLWKCHPKQYLNYRGYVFPHREFASPLRFRVLHRDFSIPPNEILALSIKRKRMDDKTKKWLSAPINPKFRLNMVPNCGEDLFWGSSIEFWDKPLQILVMTFFWYVASSPTQPQVKI